MDFRALLKKIPGAQFRRTLKLAFHLTKTTGPHFLNAPPGHFYSPIPDIREIQGVEVRTNSKECPGVDVNEDVQLNLLDAFAAYYAELPFHENKRSGALYFFQNIAFSYGDAIILYSFMRHFRPKRIIEVGSGFSSAAMLDVSRLRLQDSIQFSFIDPYPERLLQLIGQDSSSGPSLATRHEIIRKPLQRVPTETFRSLKENDILFIDSSHVLKFGSDLAHLFFDILPLLNPGVIIQFHDILWPFEYPKAWLLRGRAWNEAYALRLFLQYNPKFHVLFFNSFMAEFHSDKIENLMPLFLKEGGGQNISRSSIWLRKN